MTTLTIIQAKNGLIVTPGSATGFDLSDALVFASVDDFASYLKVQLGQAPTPEPVTPAAPLAQSLTAISNELNAALPGRAAVAATPAPAFAAAPVLTEALDPTAGEPELVPGTPPDPTGTPPESATPPDPAPAPPPTPSIQVGA